MSPEKTSSTNAENNQGLTLAEENKVLREDIQKSLGVLRIVVKLLSKFKVSDRNIMLKLPAIYKDVNRDIINNPEFDQVLEDSEQILHKYG